MSASRHGVPIVVVHSHDTADTSRAVQNGANTLAESFLFFVGAALVLGETYRSSRKNAERRDNVAEDIAWLKAKVEELEKKENNRIEEVDQK